MVRWRYGLAVRAALLCGAPRLAAQDAASSQPPLRGPTLPDVVAYALRSNPDLAIARSRADSAHGEQRIARGMPNPTFTVIPGNPFQYSVGENLDVGPGRWYRTNAAARATAAARFDVLDTQRQVVFAVRQAYYDVLLAEGLRGIAAEQADVVHRLLLADSARYREGDLPRKDVVASELALAHARAALARTDAGGRAARMNLQVLMGVPHPDTAFRVSGELAYQPLNLPLDSLRAVALAGRPDVAATTARVDQSRLLNSLATASLVPVPGLAAVYQPSEPFSTGSRYALGLSFTMPLLYWFGGERERARAGLGSARVALRATETQVTTDVAVASDNYRAAQALAEQYASGLLDRARESVELQRFAYEQGNASLTDVLNAITALADTQTDYYTALHDYWVSAYAINRATGRELTP
jgi:cobalt-zinc-cadmium efflux system outer membrane protein